MKILSRYVLREFLAPCLCCLAGFASIYVLFELFGSFSRLVEAKLPAMTVVRYFCAYVSPYFHYLASAALLLATLYTMWTFCRHSEIVAMRSSGIGFFTIVKPLLAVALVMAAAVCWVNERYVPRYAQWAVQLRDARFESEKMEKLDNVVFHNEQASRTWTIDRFLDPEGRRLADVRVAVDRPNGGARLMNVTAPRAEYLDGEWWFTDAEVRHYDADGQEVATPTPEADALRFRCFGEFRERPADFIAQNRPWRFNSVSDRLHYVRSHPKLTPVRRNELLYDAWAQAVSPLACLIITLFAIPAGIASGRQSVFRGVLGALGLYFAFYGVTIGCLVAAKGGWCPAVPAALLPDVLFLALGVRAFCKQR